MFRAKEAGEGGCCSGSCCSAVAVTSVWCRTVQRVIHSNLLYHLSLLHNIGLGSVATIYKWSAVGLSSKPRHVKYKRSQSEISVCYLLVLFFIKAVSLLLKQLF